MPYLSWMEGGQLRRHALAEECTLGRDPLKCTLAQPGITNLSRTHAALSRFEDRWWIRDLGSANGTTLNGLPLNVPQGNTLRDGDQVCLGDWALTYTEGFPGLDGSTFVERVGELLEEVKPEPAQAMVLVQGMGLLHAATQTLLKESDANAILRSLLQESLKLFHGDRGFLIQVMEDGSWRTAHRVGDVQEGIGLSRSVVDYVLRERTAVLSNLPLGDPRFGGISLVEMPRGALLAAPLEYDGNVKGALYLDRERDARPFTRFDLAFFQSFVRMGSLALRQSLLNRKALSHAELQGELIRLRATHERSIARHGQLLAAMTTPLRWIQTWARHRPGEDMEVLRNQLDRLSAIIEDGQHELPTGVPMLGHPWKLEALQDELLKRWEPMIRVTKGALELDPAPAASAWIGAGPALVALGGLVEPLLMQLAPGTGVKGSWDQERGSRILRLAFPNGVHGPIPDPWTVRNLQEAAIRWRWADQSLTLAFPEGPEAVPEEPSVALLGLVTEELSLLDLFQSVADAGDLSLFPLEEEPPLPPLPRFRFLVIDAKGVKDPVACIHAYRHHPSFATTPILVVRLAEEDTHRVMAAGATDWLADGFRWKALHHRLQVLRGHEELQQRALAAGRLDTFRQMAGTLKHEINNPLAVISMQVEMLQRKYPEEIKLGKIAEMVERIRTLVQVLQKMREASTEDYADGSSILKLQ